MVVFYHEDIKIFIIHLGHKEGHISIFLAYMPFISRGEVVVSFCLSCLFSAQFLHFCPAPAWGQLFLQVVL